MDQVEYKKTLPAKLKHFLDTHGYANKDIAKKFEYTEQNISEYLQGKASENSKLHIIASLFLELEELKEQKYTQEQKEILEEANEKLRTRVARYEGENLALKSMIRDMQDKMSLNSAELRETIKNVIAKEGYTLLHTVSGKNGESK